MIYGYLFYVSSIIQKNKFQTKHSNNLDAANSYSQLDTSTRPRKLRTVDPIVKIYLLANHSMGVREAWYICVLWVADQFCYVRLCFDLSEIYFFSIIDDVINLKVFDIEG